MNAAEGAPPIEVTRLSKSFGATVAVNAVSFEVHRGEVFGLLGPNGAGKTTTIKILTTLLPPSSGVARVDGFDVVRQSRSVQRRIGYVPQLISADPQATGYESLRLFASLYEIPSREQAARIRDGLAFMGLENAADTLIRNYSGGMIRRLEIAQSMLHRPSVLFLDEPTIGLDPTARSSVWEHVSQLREEFGTTVLFTTHYMDEAEAECHRVAIMHRGALAAIGTPKELREAQGGDATLGDVFAKLSGGELESGGGYRAVVRERRAERRLG
jgi:ABC-2 type transport system ATP-binding protein